MKILALQLKRIGDLILTTPALAALREQGEVTVAVQAGSASLLPLLPRAYAAIVFGPGRGWTPWQQVLTGRFDAVYDFTGSDRSALATALSRAPRRITYELVRRNHLRALAYNHFEDSPVRTAHTADHYLALTGETDTAPRKEFRSSRTPRLLVKEAPSLPPEPYALLHPGSARVEKYWLPERWAALITHLRGRGLHCVLTGGSDPFELAHVAEIVRRAGEPLQNLAGRLSLAEVAALLPRAALVVSVDTAMVHLAAAWRRPQVALFGPTNPFHWRPRHAQAVVLSAAQPDAPLTEFEPRMRGAPMEQLSTAAVIRATDGLLSPTHG